MNNITNLENPHAWHTPGQIYSSLQQQHYRVFNVEFLDHWYIAEALDQDDQRVALKVNPKTGRVFTWNLRGKFHCTFEVGNSLHNFT